MLCVPTLVQRNHQGYFVRRTVIISIPYHSVVISFPYHSVIVSVPSSFRFSSCFPTRERYYPGSTINVADLHNIVTGKCLPEIPEPERRHSSSRYLAEPLSAVRKYVPDSHPRVCRARRKYADPLAMCNTGHAPVVGPQDR